mgnify:CR=1 FL=1
MGYPFSVSVEDAIKTMDAHPEAKAILLVYPNYYGVGVDIVNNRTRSTQTRWLFLLMKRTDLIYHFQKIYLLKPFASGADLVAQSTHKSVGSLTQTSWLLGQGDLINKRRITQMHQMLQKYES